MYIFKHQRLDYRTECIERICACLTDMLIKIPKTFAQKQLNFQCTEYKIDIIVFEHNNDNDNNKSIKINNKSLKIRLDSKHT